MRINLFPHFDTDKSGWPWIENATPPPLERPGGNPWPKISIVTPSFNQGQFIEETIRSVLLQGYPNLEYIIIDGGSNDESIEIIKKYEPWIDYWVSEKDYGQVDAINKGFNIASGELAGWINSDDIYYPNALTTVAKYWMDSGKKDALITGTKLKGDINLKKVTRINQFPLSLDHLVERNILEQPSTFFPLSLYKFLGGLDPRYHMSLDYDLWLRMTKQGAKLIYTGSDLAITRIHPLTKTSRFQRLSAYESLLSIWRNYRVVSEPWAKKLISTLIIPPHLKSGCINSFLFFLRDVLFKFVKISLRLIKLSNYSKKI